ncbi:cupin domain-containing protein [Allochromatium warmingii]|uniref:cupin domain-containing protein n=1 Tax=Allochromatium warmingii TaxID=61595 RepID=UPI003CCB95EE
MATVRNLFADLPTPTSGECFEQLAACRGVRIERIVSSDQPEPVLYEQEQDEWVCLLQGRAQLLIAGDPVELQAGDHVFIAAHVPHQVLETSSDPPCLWLAVHIHPHEP